MVTYISGNIFTSPAKVLVNPVNTVGVMGKGLAKQFKANFPDMFKQYQKICDAKQLDIGKLWLYKTPNKWVLNFPTKTTWRKPSQLEYIQKGLEKFVNSYEKYDLSSVAFPKLGCGNGELDWETEVKPLMESYLSKIPIMVFVYLGAQTFELDIPEHRNIQKIEDWLRLEPRSLTWDEVLADLKREILINESGEVKDIVNHRQFNIELDDEEFKIVNENQTTKINLEDMKSLWVHARDLGYFNKETAPSAVTTNYDQILSMFLHLPYCQPTHVTDKYKRIVDTSESLGFVVVPPSNTEQQEPFKESLNG